MDHFADRLTAAIKARRNAVCVGLDPRWESLPAEIRQRHGEGTRAAVARAFDEFCCRVLDVVAPLVPVVKQQMAFFEACGSAGFVALDHILQRCRRDGLITILDGKRNDIASTAAAYAEAAFGPAWDVDAITINPYLGRDAVEPFLQVARRSGRGVFVLVRTSNPGAGQFQDLNCNGKPLYVHVAEAVAAWTREEVGDCGFGDVGAVVGATQPAELAAVRRLLPEAILLVPGFGAQGGAAGDTTAAFRADGLGAVVNSSRGILYPYDPDEPRWEAKVEAATRDTIAALASATPMGRLDSSVREHSAKR